METIDKGSVVKYKDGWMEVTARFNHHVNLGHIFQSKTTIKKVPLNEVFEGMVNPDWPLGKHRSMLR